MPKIELRHGFIGDSCALCGRIGSLRASHVVPRFAFEWLSKSSGTGYSRFAENPNLREQDGWKPKLLCHECEQRFGGWEKKFAERIFVPFHECKAQRFRYGSWMAQFAASVSWRVLAVHKLAGDLEKFPPEMKDAADAALARWKDFVLGQVERLDSFEQHVLALDAIESTTIPFEHMPPNINRYLLRSVDIYVGYTDDSAFVYSKMGRVLLIGFIRMPEAKRWWKNTKLHTGSGAFITTDDKAVPGYLLDFILDRAHLTARAWDRLSERQRQKINESLRRDLERVAESDSFSAMRQDVQMFGQAAFSPRSLEQ